MYKLHYPRAKGSMLKEGTTFKFEYFREFESEFEKNSGYESGIHIGSIHEINKRQKISCYCPFKEHKCKFMLGTVSKAMNSSLLSFNMADFLNIMILLK
jgi:hypothetical protein